MSKFFKRICWVLVLGFGLQDLSYANPELLKIGISFPVLEGSALLRALRTFSMDGKALKAAEAYRLMRSGTLKRQDLFGVLIRPLIQFLERETEVLRMMAQADLSA